ncbi:MAG: hypothetical protein WA783_14475 [Phormidesmis sp.]
MTKDKWLKVRLSDEEFNKLKKYSESEGWNMSQAVRELIKKAKIVR